MSWDSMWYKVKDPLKSVKAQFDAKLAAKIYGMRVFLYAPHAFYAEQGVPSQPPCRDHGWNCRKVKPLPGHYWKTYGRHCLDVVDDFIYGTTNHRCEDSYLHRKQLQTDLEELKKVRPRPVHEIKELEDLIKKTWGGMFQASDPKVRAHYSAVPEYKWVAASFGILEFKTYSISIHFDWMLQGLVRVSNVHAATNVLAEIKGKRMAERRLKFHSFQLLMRKRMQASSVRSGTDSTGQTSILQYSGSGPPPLGPPLDMTAKDINLCSPKYNFVKKAWTDSYREREDYQRLWTEKMVPVEGGVHLDHCHKLVPHLHVFSMKLVPYVLSMWNDLGQVVLSINTSTTSFSDPAVILAAKAQMAACERAGLTPPKYCRLDAPIRDAPGVQRAWSKWFKGANGMPVIHFEGDIIYLNTQHRPRNWVKECDRLKSMVSDLAYLGFDIENYAPMTSGVKTPSTSVITLCTPSSAQKSICLLLHLEPAVNWTASVDHISGRITTGTLPQAVVELLATFTLVGVGIKADVSNLSKFYPNLQHDQLRIIELSEPAKRLDVVQPKRLWTLQNLSRVALKVHLDKSLGADSNLPNPSKRVSGATSDWRAVPLQPDQKLYAANDAFASAQCYQALQGLSIQLGDDNNGASTEEEEEEEETTGGLLQVSQDMLTIASKLVLEFNCLEEDDGTLINDVAMHDDGNPDGPVTSYKEWNTIESMSYMVAALCDDFLQDESRDSHTFPSFLTSDMRNIVHEFASSHGNLTSRSIQDEQTRKVVRLTRAASTTSSNPEPLSKERFPVDSDWHLDSFNGDGFHWLALWFSMGTVASGPIFSFFYVMTSNALYLEDPQRRKDVEDHLIKSGSVTREGLKYVKRRVFKRLGKFTCPPPEAIIFNLLEVYDFMRLVVDTNTGASQPKQNPKPNLKPEPEPEPEPEREGTIIEALVAMGDS